MKVFLISILLAGLTLFMLSACVVTRSKGSTNIDKDQIPTVTICQLIQNPDRFHEKVVRTRGIHEKGFEKSYLYDSECKDHQSQIWVSHDKSIILKGESDEAKKNRMISGFGRWSVTMVGRFLQATPPQRFGHIGCCQYEFDIVRVEKSEKLPDQKR